MHGHSLHVHLVISTHEGRASGVTAVCEKDNQAILQVSAETVKPARTLEMFQ